MASQGGEENATNLLFWEPQDIVVIKVWKKDYKVHRELLAQDSEVFKMTVKEADDRKKADDDGQPVEIDLGEEFRSSEFGVYVDTLYRSYFVHNFRLRKDHVGKYQPLVNTLSLWKLANRFCNAKITAIATESIKYQLSIFDTNWWARIYSTRSDEGMLNVVKSFEKAALKCETEGLPFLDEIIRACSNMPPQVYQQHLEKIFPGFAKELSKKLTMRFADPSLQSPIKRSRSVTPTEDGNFLPGDNTVIELD